MEVKIQEKRIKKIIQKSNIEILEEKLNLLDRPSTFGEFYDYLSILSKNIKTYDEFIYLMNHSKYTKSEFEKQETTLRLFTYLNVIPEFYDYQVSTFDSNASKCKLNFVTEKDTMFYHELSKRNIKDKGDISDLTLYKEGELILSTSKNYIESTLSLRKMDILPIIEVYEENKINTKYSFDTLKICIMIPDKEVLKEKIEQCEKNDKINEKIINILEDNTKSIIFDWDDLYYFYTIFKKQYIERGLNTFDKIFESELIQKKSLSVKFHQELTIYKTLQMIRKKVSKMIWGHVCRSGKSYMIAQLIYQLSLMTHFNNNYLLLTTAPSETIQQYVNIFKEYMEFHDFDIYLFNESKRFEVNKKNKNIIIASLQMMKVGNKAEEKRFIQYFKKIYDIEYQIMFVDEAHLGGTTDLACKIFDKIHCHHTIFTTATYTKPMEVFQISHKNGIFLNLYDYKLFSQIKDNDVQSKICERYDISKEELMKILENFSKDAIEREYSDIPNLHLLTMNPNQRTLDHIFKEKHRNEHSGLSVNSLLLLKEEEKIFQNELLVERFLIHLFGNERDAVNFDMDEEDFFGSKSEVKGYMSRIHEIRRMKEYKEDPTHKHKDIIMVFLPFGITHHLSDLSDALMKKMSDMAKDGKIRKYRTISVNSEKNKGYDAKSIIYEEYNKLESDDKGLIVFSGKQCHLGVTLEDCDIVILMNNLHSFDTLYQMMFRGMSSRKHKKNGFVVDLNTQRSVNLMVDLSLHSYPDSGIHESITTMLKSHVIHFNRDNWKDYYDSEESYSFDIFQSWTHNQKDCINTLVSDFYTGFELPIHYQKTLDEMIMKGKTFRRIDVDELEGKQVDLPDGIEKTIKRYSPTGVLVEDKKEEDYVSKIHFVKDVLTFFLPLLCILTIRDNTHSFDDMLNVIQSSEKYLLMKEQLKIRWSKIDTDVLIDLINDIFTDIFSENQEMIVNIKRMKELFKIALYDIQNLSQLVDAYFSPSESEKENMAEISTPRKLRDDMLNSMPLSFWNNPSHTVFEPCSGKGGFVLDILYRYMNGLKDIIEDDKERHRHIVENCIYFSDINPMNIYICNLLLNPFNEFKTNSYLGDTLKINIKELWSKEGFHAVIGNPPYNDNSGNKGKGHSIWTYFVEKALDEWLNKDGFLLYVHPALWRQIDHPLFNKIKNKQMIYLEIHNVSDGLKMFKCSTRYDWYLLKNIENTKSTLVKSEDGLIENIEINKVNFIPNSMFHYIYQLCSSDEKIEILYSTSVYDVRRKYMSHTKSKEFCKPCIYSINIDNKPSLKWSSEDKGHFDIPKFIFSNGAGFIVDKKGKYGLTQWSYAIVDDILKLDIYEKIFKMKKFNDVIKAIHLDSSSYNIKILKQFNKKFYEYFI